MKFDVIGDIHGFADPLKQLLRKMGYELFQGQWKHPDRRAVFLGDFIDRGPDQVEVVRIVQGMVASGAALAVMGNHELNAIAWYYGFRKKTTKNRDQHHRFLEAVVEGSALHQDLIEWFITLPLWLDLEGIRVVHACWHKESILFLQDFLVGSHLKKELLEAVCTKGADPKSQKAFESTEILLKGMEAKLPEGLSFLDKDSNPRHRIRTQWWNPNATTYRSAVTGHGADFDALPDDPLPDHLMINYEDAQPVFFGHYWHSGIPSPLRPNTACLDYSVANRGKLCAYRWEGEKTLTHDHFIWVDCS